MLHKIDLKKLKPLKICLIGLALSSLLGCNKLPKFPTDRVWETDTQYKVCGEYRIVDAKKMQVAHVRDWPLEKCNGVFGFSTSDAGKIFRWSEKAQAYVEKNCN